MNAHPGLSEGSPGPWDEEHAKALLSFPRYPIRLVQDEPWQTWISQRGGIKGVYDFLRAYSFAPSHRRILDVVLSNPDEIADVYANHLNISRATYFYRLKELVPAVVHALNQWQIEGAAARSEQRRTSAAREIPTPLTSLITYDWVVRRSLGMIGREDVRLLTLIGPGGVGKTRLAIEVARQAAPAFRDRVFFIDLSGARAGASIMRVIGDALDLPEADEPEIQAALASLGGGPTMMVLDNFERLLDQAALIGSLLAGVPALKIIVTSRAALHVYGEHQFSVPPLATPEPGTPIRPEDQTRIAAVDLFVQRAQAVNPAFSLTTANASAVGELCAQLDGIPLWIEIAAFQARYYSPQAMLVRLSTGGRLAFLKNIPQELNAQQQPPREMLDESYGLLGPELQTLLNRLAVFAEGCTTDAAEFVCGPISADEPASSAALPAALVALTEQSLLDQRLQTDGEPRYSMIGVVRDYGLEHLDQRGETADIQRRFAFYFLDLAERSGGTPTALPDVMEREDANMIAAIEWFLENKEGEGALRLIEAMWDTWRVGNSLAETYRLAQRALEQTIDLALPIRARVLWLIGWQAYQRSDPALMRWAFGEMRRVANDLHDQHFAGLANVGLAEIARGEGRWADALALLGEAGDTGWALLERARIEFSRGEMDACLAHCRESGARFNADADRAGKTYALALQGEADFYLGRFEQAMFALEDSRHIRVEMGDQFSAEIARVEILLAMIEARHGRIDVAERMLDRCIVIAKRGGFQMCLDLACDAQAEIALGRDDIAGAKRALRECLLIQETVKEGWRVTHLLESVGWLLADQSESLAAARLLGAAASLRATMQIARFGTYEAITEETITSVRETLDEAVFEDAWQAGQELAMDQAVRYALRCLE